MSIFVVPSVNSGGGVAIGGDVTGASGSKLLVTDSSGKVQEGTAYATVLAAAMAGTAVSLGNVSGSVPCDLSQGTVFIATVTGPTTFTFTNWPALPIIVEPLIAVTQDSTGGHTVTIGGTVSPFPAGSTLEIDTTANVLEILPFTSYDGGTTIIVQTLDQAIASMQADIASLQDSVDPISDIQSDIETLQTNAALALYGGIAPTVTRPSYPGKAVWTGSTLPATASIGDVQDANLEVLSPLPAFVQTCSAMTPVSGSASVINVPLSVLGVLPTVGNTLFMWAFNNATGTTFTGIDDPEGNTWEVELASTIWENLTLLRCYVENPYDVDDVLPLASSLAVNNAQAGIAEFKNLLNEPPDAGMAVTNGNNGTASTTFDCGTTGQVANAGDLILTGFSCAGTYTGGSGWNSPAPTSLKGWSGVPYGALDYRFAVAAGDIEHPIYTAGTARKYTGLTAVYKGAS